MNSHDRRTKRLNLCGWTYTLFGVVVVASQMMAGETNHTSSYKLGVANVDGGKWSEAITNFTDAIRNNPKDALAYEYRGVAYFMTGAFDNAIKDCTQILELDPANTRALGNRASAYTLRHQFDEAMHDFNECLRLNPTNAFAYKGRADCYSEKGEFDKAIKDWNEGLRLSPNDARALVVRGFDYSKTSQFEKAVQDYTEAIRLDPQNDKAYNNLGWLRATCPSAEFRNGKEAVELATKACQLTNWKKWDWIDTLAAAFAEAGDFKSAIKYEKQAMEMCNATESYRKEMQRCLSLYEQQKPNHEGQKQ